MKKAPVKKTSQNSRPYSQYLRDSKDQLDTVFKNAPDAVIVANDEGRILKWNPKAEALFEWTEQEAVGNFLHTTIIPERYREAHLKGLEHFRKSGEGPVLNKTIEITAINKSNREFDVALSISPCIVKDRYYFTAFIRDITQQKKIEATLKKNSEELARSNKELEQFAYVVSHDLKAPLRAISNLSQWLEEDIENNNLEDVSKNILLLRDRVNRMDALINSILAYSRVGQKEVSPEITDVSALVKEVIDTITTSKKIRFETDPNLPVLNTNRTRLGQVFLNLIGNAVKHHHREKGRVRISAADKGNYYEFSVSDNGPGIDPAYHEKIFVMFEALEPSSDSESTGIGLAIVKKSVEGAGGTIKVDSAPGKGSDFIFTWPKEMV